MSNRIAITLGDPGAIGPDICVKMVSSKINKNHVIITDPSLRRAAKEFWVDAILVTSLALSTPLRSEATEVESPPASVFPQVTTDPSSFNAAKAPLVE